MQSTPAVAHDTRRSIRRRSPPRGLALLTLLLATGAGAAGQAPVETTLEIEPTVEVDLNATQSEAERKAALQRAADAARLPHAREREAMVPEFLLLQREVLVHLPVISSRPDGARQTWRVRSAFAPEMYAQRVIPHLLRAGFSSGPRCAGEEWGGTHGSNRVSVIAEQRTVAIVLVPASTPCPVVPAP